MRIRRGKGVLLDRARCAGRRSRTTPKEVASGGAMKGSVDCATLRIVYSRVKMSCDRRSLSVLRQFLFALLTCFYVLGLSAGFAATLAGRDDVSQSQTCSQRDATTDHPSPSVPCPLCDDCTLCAFGCGALSFAGTCGRKADVRFSSMAPKISSDIFHLSIALRERAHRARAPPA